MSTPTTFENDVTVNARLFVTDDIVFGSAIATGTTTNYGDVDNKKDVSIGNRLFVKKDAKITKRLFVDSKSYLYNDINVVGKVKCNTLEVTDGFTTTYAINSIPSNAIAGIESLNKDLGTKKRLFVDNDTTLKKRLFVTNTSTFYNNASFLSDVNINGVLNVDDINITGDLTREYYHPQM